MPRAIQIPNGETRKIIDESQPTGRYEFDLRQGEILLSDRRADAPEGRRLTTLRPGFFIKDETTESVYAHTPDTVAGDSEIEVAKSRFEINLFPPATLKAQKQNMPELAQDVVAVGTTATAFADIDVPDGFEVVVQNSPSSGSNVSVLTTAGGVCAELQAGDSYSAAVDNFKKIQVEAASGSQTVIASVESSAATNNGTGS